MHRLRYDFTIALRFFTEFIFAQVLSYLAYVMRFSGEIDENYGEGLVLSSLRMLQDCPANGIALRKVFFQSYCSLRCILSLMLGINGRLPALDGDTLSKGIVSPLGQVV